jgi:cytochrome c oxidase assembly protein subunit 15
MTAFSGQHGHDRAIARWLIMVAILIFAMVILGGVTRLTGSGLSMVEWAPIMGAVPPLSEDEWLVAFDKYKQYPEYQKINQAMSLSEFKGIFAFEYAHRLLGRFIGLAFLIPFLFFYFKKQIRPGLLPKLILMFVLGGLQGGLGWIMVQSGMVDQPNVSQYKLAAHFSAAILIYGYILWTAWNLLYPDARNSWAPGISRLQLQIRWLTAIIILMIISGAFVAGTHAGAMYKTFPDMNGHFLPPGLFDMTPFLLNIFDNPTTIQFNHRIIAYTIILFVSYVWWRSRKYTLTYSARRSINLLMLMMIIQVTLGISTLLSEPHTVLRGGVSVPLGAAHQGGALLLFTIVLYVNHELRKGKRL